MPLNGSRKRKDSAICKERFDRHKVVALYYNHLALQAEDWRKTAFANNRRRAAGKQSHTGGG